MIISIPFFFDLLFGLAGVFIGKVGAAGGIGGAGVAGLACGAGVGAGAGADADELAAGASLDEDEEGLELLEPELSARAALKAAEFLATAS